ncbi:glycoside hydrolase family 43 protein [Curtobacterium sp. VKM Ac-1376]|uniref:glycoside hydrolase family 43 protein n=1 Tax=Curtobacterium sp. VKM Ac-1376 TaxID=123312 RepID=UPI00188D11E1|nr:glycoside hydrolase family 43 protein [Curtobacterium sp. VKM Ac-1376]MBF4616365.1 glycoside hydrolase family 43 protein [Curtobacterium sp. VKM Ac-1376]
MIKHPGTDHYGYLLVHFVEAPNAHGERVYFSLSEGDDPHRWYRLNGGAPVLESSLGTTGVRDPYIVRGTDEFFLFATDLRVWGSDATWDGFVRHGSRSIVVWRSEDLVEWSEPWLAEVAPPEAGMAWAPEATFDAETGTYSVYWSSHLYTSDDPDHRDDSYSRVLIAKTRDFREFSSSEVLIDLGRSVIDTTIVQHAGRTYRFSKDDSRTETSLKLFQEEGSSLIATDYRVTASKIADDFFDDVEGPLIFWDHARETWNLWVDQYSRQPQGYIPLTSDSLEQPHWAPVPPSDFRLPPNTKHGVVLPLQDDEWHRLTAAYKR